MIMIDNVFNMNYILSYVYCLGDDWIQPFASRNQILCPAGLPRRGRCGSTRPHLPHAPVLRRLPPPRWLSPQIQAGADPQAAPRHPLLGSQGHLRRSFLLRRLVASSVAANWRHWSAGPLSLSSSNASPLKDINYTLRAWWTLSEHGTKVGSLNQKDKRTVSRSEHWESEGPLNIPVL